MAERKADEGKTVAFSVRIEPSLRDGLATLASRHGVKSGRYLRRLIREAQTAEPQFFPDELDALAGLSTQVKAVGRNVNQMAKRLNRADAAELAALTPARAELKEIRDMVRAVKAEVQRLEAGATKRHIRLRKAGAGERA